MIVLPKYKNTKRFSPAAEYFKEHGVYTKHIKGTIQYKQYWDEQTRRSRHGYTVKDATIDGKDVTITGYHYFYLNFCQITQVVHNKNTGKDDEFRSMPDFWDYDVEYFNYIESLETEKENGIVLKGRRKGYSYKAGSMLCRNYFLYPNSKGYAIAYDKQYLIGDGLLTKAWDMMDFIDTNTAWSKRRTVKDSDMHRRASYKEKSPITGVDIEKGFKSEIIGISLKDTPHKIRGKTGKLMFFEEVGTFPNIVEAWKVTTDSVRQGMLKRGILVAYGTGGEEGANFEGAWDLFTKPRGNEILPCKTLNKNGDFVDTGFFVPAYTNIMGAMDADGNSDCERGLEFLEAMAKEKEHSKDFRNVTHFWAENPRYPEDIFLSTGQNVFPTDDIKSVLAEVESSAEKQGRIESVRLVVNTAGEVVADPTNGNFLTMYPTPKGANLNCDVVIYERPQRLGGAIPYGMYVAGLDSYDHDRSTTDSLGSLFVMNRLTGNIVCEYTARPENAVDFYETCRRVLMYYNALCNYENHNLRVLDYFEKRHSLHLLCDTPRIVLDRIVDNVLKTRRKGSPPTKPVNELGIGLINTYLRNKVTESSEITNTFRLRQRALMYELIKYDGQANCDRVSALGMLMILKEDMEGIVYDKAKKEDGFFDNIYKKAIHKKTPYIFSKPPITNNQKQQA